MSETPVIAAMLNTGDTVTVSMINRSTGAVVSLSGTTATEQPTGSGRYKYTFALTTPPTSGKNYYDVKFTGTLQTRWVTVNWSDDASKYSGVVHLNTTGIGVSGTAYPIGTDFMPVSNLTDAKTIATRLNTKTIKITGNLTLDSSVAGYIFEGVGYPVQHVITLNGQNVLGTMFREVSVTGTSGGQLFYAYNCWFNDITNLNARTEFIKIGGAFIMVAGGMFTCVGAKSQGTSPVTFNMSVASGVGLLDSDGIFVFSNLGHPAGYIGITGNHNTTLEATITAGIVILAGIGHATILGTPTSLLNQLVPDSIFNEDMNPYTTPGTAGHAISSITFDNAVWIDTGSAFSGTTYPIGTSFAPVNNLADALTIATARSFKNFKVRGTVVVTVPIEDYVFEGSGSIMSDIFVLTGTSIDGSLFKSLTVTGTQLGIANYGSCVLQNITGFWGVTDNCSFDGTITLAGFGSYLFAANGNSISNTTIDMVGPGRIAKLRASGAWTVSNCQTGIPFPTDFGLAGEAAQVTFDATCTGGTGGIMGDTVVINNGAIVVNNISFEGRHGEGNWESEAVWGHEVETGMTLSDSSKIMLAILAGKTDITDHGDGTATVKFRDTNDTVDRVTAELDGSERTSITFV
jgi:hypothetical protein